MEPAVVTLLSPRPHVSQITTGFLMLSRRLGSSRFPVKVQTEWNDPSLPEYQVPVVRVDHRGLRIYYDMEDSYWTYPRMQYLLDQCDMYFKRSFSEEVNRMYFTPEQQEKMRPLGFNYFTDCKGNPVHRTGLSSRVRRLAGRQTGYFPPSCFEHDPSRPEEFCGRAISVLFFTRLWDPGSVREDEYREDRDMVNRTRIQIIRTLKKELGPAFRGGLLSDAYSRKTAPDLIMPGSMTAKRRYLDIMQNTDICIGSTGLHGSIGWKTGEYVAASRTILDEPFQYTLPGEFLPGKNYLPYKSADECCRLVTDLIRDPERIAAMQNANYQYYKEYVDPEKMVSRTLAEACSKSNNK